MIFRFCTYPLYVSCCPIMSFESLLTYPSSDKPSQPGTPEITDYDEESVGFRWAPSQSDGGSPITHYIIQMRLNGKDWEKLDDFKTPTGNESLTYKHIGLSLKDKVQYRTIAVNKAGESPPSEPSPVHTVKHKKRKFSTPPRQLLQIKVYLFLCPVIVCPFNLIFQLWLVDFHFIKTSSVFFCQMS